MATTGVVNSKLLKIFTGGTPTAVTCLTDASLSINNAMRQTTCKDSGQWEDNLPAQTSWSISGSALLAFDSANGVDELSTIALAQTSVDVVFGTGVTGDTEWSGSGYIQSFELSSPGTNENSTYSFEITGTGELTQATTV